MPITPHPKPVYSLTCDNDDCCYLADIDGDGRLYFESPEEARAWAFGWGWARDVTDSTRLLCMNCAAEQAGTQSDLDHHNAEIAAAVQYALDLPSTP
ncbi:hypothetical protein OG594_08795 [Streptomyces sp. NBC_01214]|uniref:hypothetical protein n=1 Tax=Streptomyces sp. NBC_01214 TaxID=2903777 RepID=UPI002257FA24|nr:hypothetical protein [Streptomyces sp. NBC_01214]MCX4801747.1 hypothetical protein [Streptomyces sp. NBC_01214]